MLFMVLGMVISMVAAGLVVLYVAYPHRGQRMPGVPWVGEAMGRAADAAPVIDEVEGDLLRQR
ncbi:hypothetical protein E8D34_07530 [Nocardioides sp. GY 10113]|uniref:hypothetical protein n=1 Tax=Nocardioides sp. GY 10113 TaxID=2569761 RepID=UPI0010A88FB8|nr:hypothetical protein [Nocardioides sp. GY 10113]TIC88126.1 hypothetical protein E8D34_07530 [Nocardioides sp. GY 10113]